MYIEPNTNIKLLHNVPLDNTYEHTILFSNSNDQANYFASLTFVFDVDKSKSHGRNFVIFMVCSIIGLGLNDLFVWLITDICHVYYMISKVIATVFVMIFNFVTRKKFLE